MNRRGFLKSMLIGMVAPAFLPGAGRSWKQTESELWINDVWYPIQLTNYQIAWTPVWFLSKTKLYMFPVDRYDPEVYGGLVNA